MLIGNRQNFAIEIEILDTVDDWVFGTFVLWILGSIVGSLEDKSVDLKGCINWLKEFIEVPKDRFEPGLYELDKKQAYILLCSSVLVGEGDSFVKEKYKDTYSRFHVSHIGMSSFDDVTMVFVENKQGDVRCIWKQNDQEIQEAFLKLDDVYKVAIDAVAYFDSTI